jgi:endonuclease/exonuclease/phosphatase family metal-dependent hydrolase
LLHATVQIHARKLHVIVVHLGLIAASRQRQMAQLSRYIHRHIPQDEALVVAGDFNSPIAPVRWAQAALASEPPSPQGVQTQRSQPTRMLHALRGHATFPSRLPMIQLDHVFTRHARIQSSHVPQEPQWARMSDHLPLMVEVAW